MYRFKVGDTITVSDMAGTYEIISISPVSYHIVDLILRKNDVNYFVRRRKFQLSLDNKDDNWYDKWLM